MANWSELPEDILALFVKRLAPCVKEVVRFSCVCESWRSAAMQEKRKLFGAPWLMLSKLEHDHGEAIRDCYSSVYSSDKILSLKLPELGGRRCWGTQYGWLITLGLDFNMSLFNPLTKTQLPLPPQPTFPPQGTDWDYSEEICRHFFTNFALSSNPSESGHSVVIMALYGGSSELAFASPTHKSWTKLKCPFAANFGVVFFKGRFYSISVNGMLRMCDIDTATTSEPEAKEIAPPPSGIDGLGNFYLVEISGNLHLILRGFTFVHDRQHTTAFHAYKFDFEQTKWVDVQSFDDYALFVGNNTSFGISTLDWPEFKSNAIYFTDDYSDVYEYGYSDMGGYCDMGVYDFGSKAVVRPLYKTDRDLLSKFSRPFIFMPSA